MSNRPTPNPRSDVAALTEPLCHEWDDDGCCIRCGFDGAEWWHWKHMTYEGKAQPQARMPRCKENA